jgi:hypothetical protein
MATTSQPGRAFNVALSPTDGLVRITRSDTGRVALALNIDEAAQIRAGLKGALQPIGKNGKKSNKQAKPKRS